MESMEYFVFEKSKDGTVWKSPESYVSARDHHAAQMVTSAWHPGVVRWAETLNGSLIYGLSEKGKTLTALEHAALR